MNDPAMPAPETRPTNTRAIISLICGIATLVVIPVVTLLFAPCGFPLALLSGLTAILTGRRARIELKNSGGQGDSLAKTGLLTAWIGLGLNFLLMLLKLAMFIGLIILPLWAILNGSSGK